jgi:protein-tyrosine phosphatase
VTAQFPRQRPTSGGQAGARTAVRQIAWAGFANARDLGGLPARGGQVTRHGTFIRSGDLRFVSTAGWQAAVAAGVRTVVDLRNDDEIRPQAAASQTRLAGSAQLAAGPPIAGAPASIHRVHVAIDDVADTGFWQYLNRERLNGTPLYYRPFLERKPGRCAAVITALASAVPGGVLFHCGAGRDRTGLVTMLLLALAGVDPEAIADDYVLSAEPVRALFARLGLPDQGPGIDAALAARGSTGRQAMLSALDGFDAERYLLAAGVSPSSIGAIRTRLLG